MAGKESVFASKIIKTIEDDDEVEDFSEDSNAEVEFQPLKHKKNKEETFDTNFEFVSSVDEYNKDSWNDLNKYIKRKAKTKTDDKIKKLCQQEQTENIKANPDLKETSIEVDVGDLSLSEDELQHDKIKNKEKRKKKNTANVSEIEKSFFEDLTTYDDNVNFYQMNLSRPLLKAISEMKFIHPTPIQAATIPTALLGRDICGCAATGTGKTAAYMLPTLERLLYRPINGPAVTRVLVLVPTRELGVQVYQVSKQLCQFTNIEICLAVGGLDLKAQEIILRKGPDIVIATPGRLIDHLKSTPSFSVDSVEILILDEADRMLDEYFAEQMKEIIKQCSRTRQTMLFSATMTDEVHDLATVSLQKPVRIFVDSNKEVAFNLRQEFIRIRANKEAEREPTLAALVCRTFRSHCMIFVPTKKQAHRLHIVLGLLGVRVAELHGNLTQPQRLDALEKFKTDQVDVLVATDVAARGLDIFGVKTVINFMMPPTLEHYIHRVGRTARAGRAGVSVSLAGEQERKIVKEVVKRAKATIKSRVIPPEILEKYKKKLERMEPQVVQILQEEYEERMLSKMENQTNRAQKLLNGEAEERRPWFQTKQQRKDEKERLTGRTEGTTDNKKQEKSGNKKKPGKNRTKENDDEKRIQNEMKKVVSVQARIAKKKMKPKKINAVFEKTEPKKNNLKSKKSNFTDDYCDVSKKGAKKLRYESNVKGKNDKKRQKKR